mmetsp:Transcript_34288/g.81789  ORF Transcript_34288/g.81789 Transcript_34288/m.81789 type:complete len:328 (-) Transcript_34288:330-1313(-)
MFTARRPNASPLLLLASSLLEEASASNPRAASPGRLRPNQKSSVGRYRGTSGPRGHVTPRPKLPPAVSLLRPLLPPLPPPSAPPCKYVQPAAPPPLRAASSSFLRSSPALPRSVRVLAGRLLLQRRRLRQRALRRPRVLPVELGLLGGLGEGGVLVLLDVRHAHPEVLVDPAEELPRCRVEQVPLVPLQEALDALGEAEVGELDGDELVSAHDGRLRVHPLEPALLERPTSCLLAYKRVDVALVRVQRLVRPFRCNVYVFNLALLQHFSIELMDILLLSSVVDVPRLDRDLELGEEWESDCRMGVGEAVVRLLADGAARLGEEVAQP